MGVVQYVKQCKIINNKDEDVYKDSNMKELYHLIKPVGKDIGVWRRAWSKIQSIFYKSMFSMRVTCTVHSADFPIQNIILAVPSFSLSNVINVALQNTLVGGKGRMWNISQLYMWVYFSYLFLFFLVVGFLFILISIIFGMFAFITSDNFCRAIYFSWFRVI